MSQPKNRGVLPINAAATRKSNKSVPRTAAPRLRLIIRRLPPGLTEEEFWGFIGSEWQIGGGKVDWAAFKAGKISKDLAKPSRPARAYLKVKEQALLDHLSHKVKQTVFQDAKNTSRDSCLVGPPSLEFAPYNKTSSGRTRHDGRQGTIDQDPEFIDFLQSLTEPIIKASNAPEGGEVKKDDITITPLVQYIKEKKANKAKEKEAAATKASKKQEQKEAKATASSKSEGRSKVVVKSKSSQSEKDKDRSVKSSEDTTLATSQSATPTQVKGSSKKSEAKSANKETATPAQTSNKRERPRGDASVAARLVARDLGLVPKEKKSNKGQPSQNTATSSEPSTSKKLATKTLPSSPATPAQSGNVGASSTQVSAKSIQPPTGPKNTRQPSQQHKQASVVNGPKSQKQGPQTSPGAKSAFLKHANPSQGVTEDLLRTTFGVYGAMTRCEIDKKKGLGYIDFVEPEALRNAMAASPVKVGNGQVVVLENRSPYKKGGAGGSLIQPGATDTGSVPASTSSAVASAASSPKPAVAGLVSSQPLAEMIEAAGSNAIPTEETATVTADTTVTEEASIMGTGATPPTAPRSNRSGGRAQRGGRGYRGRGRGGGRGGAVGGGSNATQTATSGAAGQSNASEIAKT